MSTHSQDEASRQAARDLLKNIQERPDQGETELARRTVDLVSNVFDDPDKAEKAFAKISSILQKSSNVSEVGVNFDKILRSAAKSFGPEAPKMLEELLRIYQKKIPGIGRPQGQFLPVR